VRQNLVTIQVPALRASNSLIGPSTPSRTWLLNTGPSGLKTCNLVFQEPYSWVTDRYSTSHEAGHKSFVIHATHNGNYATYE
jgi:hypothetical protein